MAAQMAVELVGWMVDVRAVETAAETAWEKVDL